MSFDLRFPSVNYPPEKTHYVEKIEGYVEDSVKKTWETYCKYVYHCCCTIMDTVPKAIEYHLVTNLNKKLRQRLMAVSTINEIYEKVLIEKL